MLYTHFTEELLGLQGVKVTNIEKEDKNIIIYLEMERKSHSCPCCGTATETIHDYLLQRVKDIPSFGKNIVLKLRKRRYRCPNCGKRFYENNSFLTKERDIDVSKERRQTQPFSQHYDENRRKSASELAKKNTERLRGQEQ